MYRTLNTWNGSSNMLEGNIAQTSNNGHPHRREATDAYIHVNIKEDY